MSLGSICILLEDLGFKTRNPDADIEKMTYCHHLEIFLYEKIYADVDKTWALEVCYASEIPEIHIDRWKLEDNGLYMVSEELSLNIHNPSSIEQTVNFIRETIIIAGEL